MITIVLIVGAFIVVVGLVFITVVSGEAHEDDRDFSSDMLP